MTQRSMLATLAPSLRGTCAPSALAAGLLLAAGAAGAAPAVEQWGCFEAAFDGPAVANPYRDVELAATFSQGAQRIRVSGFWNGGTRYVVRFSPPTTGEWRYETQSNRPELNGRTGAFTAGPPSAGNHGPVQVRDTWYFVYADGAPYHQFGTTCYAWNHQPRELQEQTLKTLSTSPFNKIRFCVFPKSYTYNRNEPERFAFQRKADGSFDFDRPDPAFWEHLEARILDLQRLGIEADLILWHPYDRWGFSEMSKEQDDRYLRLCIARLAAYRNVWWSLANEFDLMAPGAMKGHRGNKEMADWDRFFQILEREDAHSRPRGIHNCRGFYDHARPWVTHCSIQSSDFTRVREWRERYRKPVVFDECRYEGDVPQGWGNISAREMARRFWLGTLDGAYVGHGETYLHPDEILWWSKGGVLHGQSPARIRWLKEFMAEAPAFAELQPLGQGQGERILARPGAFYLLYCADARPRSLDLAGDVPYKVDAIDPWEMRITPLGTAPAGRYTVAPARADLAYRFIPYAPGEKQRPEPKITASVTEGTAPLAVAFRGEGAADVRWDFGDGATSAERAPTHVFKTPGIYTVSLSATDPEAGSARASLTVVVDRESREPIVRVGVATGETPPLKLNGTARRTPEGGLLLPDGAPWGWAAAGDDVLDDLRGLRSFTLRGWLKPDSLQAGSGGNRILFCLNGDHSGIDLVCHADGRLRLSVNEWPDRVKNDSSPGRLVPGKWTLFTVTYDGTRATENVRWYFSAPLAAPDPAASVTLDRVTSYAAGPVGVDIGPLAIGNFNATMHGHGLDRQFRGEIRDLQLFGSRLDGRGALPVQTLNAAPPPPAAAAPEAGGESFPPGGALAGERFRVIVSTDIGGSDPDDFQSMVHYLVYADLFDTEGLISSPPHAGRKAHLLEVIDAYEKDYAALKRRSDRFPSPGGLREVARQGAIDPAPAAGYSTPTEGSQWIVERARADDPRPLWILVWGSITDVAQALHDDPSIKPKLRVYSIGSWNTKMDPAARDYVYRHHPDLWLIEADTTFRGMYVGGRQEGDLGNREFVARHIKGHGALGDLLAAKKADIKMGDTPSVLYLLRGPADDPTAGHWGGAFVRKDSGRSYWTDNPDPALKEKDYPCARTVSRWREQYLRDWQARMAWLRR